MKQITIEDVTSTAYDGRYPWSNEVLLEDFLEFTGYSRGMIVDEEVLTAFKEFRGGAYRQAVKLLNSD